MVNTLTAEAGLVMGNVVLGTLVKHYIDRNKAKHAVQLRRDELMYDEVFNIVKVRCCLSMASAPNLKSIPSASWICRHSASPTISACIHGISFLHIVQS